MVLIGNALTKSYLTPVKILVCVMACLMKKRTDISWLDCPSRLIIYFCVCGFAIDAAHLYSPFYAPSTTSSSSASLRGPTNVRTQTASLICAWTNSVSCWKKLEVVRAVPGGYLFIQIRGSTNFWTWFPGLHLEPRQHSLDQEFMCTHSDPVEHLA